MMDYSPPLRDIQFVMHELLNASNVFSEMPEFSDVNAPLIDQIAEEIGRFAVDVLAPLNKVGDQSGCRLEDGVVKTPPGFLEAYKSYCDSGWPGLSCHPEHGGQGLPQTLFTMMWEMLVACNHAWTMYSGLTQCAYSCLEKFASPELKEIYLQNIVNGSWTVTMALSEGHAGTDLGLMNTRAEESDDGIFKITGTKIFVSAGDHELAENIVHLVLARRLGASKGSKGLSLFLIPKRIPQADGSFSANSVSCGGIEHKMGLNGNATCVMNFDAAAGWLIGEADRGLSAMFVMMNLARLQCGMQGLGHSEASMQAASVHAEERIQGRAPLREGRESEPADPIIMHPAVQRILLAQRAYTEGGRAFAYWTSLMLDKADSHPSESARADASELVSLVTPIVKSVLTENGVACANKALQVFGGHGYIKEYGIEQRLRDCRAGPLYEGTNEIQAIDLLIRKILPDHKSLESLFKLIEQEAAHEQGEEFSSMLISLVSKIRSLTDDLRKQQAIDQEAPYRIASDYLHLLGHCILAWFWAWSARVARTQTEVNDPFYEGKVNTARYYFRYELPAAFQAAAVAQACEASLTNPDPLG